ncbi:MAG: ABC transporter ATP-binding protein [Desulfurococcales archaeon]|nr:ABC transporter ATP-binding protein [Desulfurococcales archaeon]
MACTVELEGVEVWGGGRRILWVENLVLTGGLTLVIGPNGSGKTTLLETIAGARKHSGRIRVCGTTPGKARRMIAYVPAQPSIDPLARGEDVLRAGMYGLKESPPPGRLRLIPREFLDRRISTLSSGEQRLTCLERGLARRPHLLLLDEPLSFLDIRNQSRVVSILREYMAETGAHIIFTAHELLYLPVADSVLLLSNGMPAYYGPPGGMGRKILEEAYGVELAEIEAGGHKFYLPRTLVDL